MKSFLYIVLTLCFVSSVKAQSITGKIQSASGAGIEAATVRILNTDKSAVANKEGRFTIANISAGNYQLSISSIGFASQVVPVAVSSGATEVSVILQEQQNQLDEVLVSSEKREDKLQKVPLAVSVITDRQLKNYRIWDVRDLEAVAPNLFVIEHAGSTGANFVNIRGVMGFTPEQSVATYVDGVYQYEYYSAPSQYLDVQRIEVLRGPQGTLYGRNSLSGVVSITTKQPTNAASGQVELNVGNYGQQRYSGTVTFPVVKDKLFASASFMYVQRGAVFTNDGKPYDKQYGQAFNAGLKYIANAHWNFNLNVKGNYAKDHGAYPWQTVTNIDSLLKTSGAYNVSFSNPNIEERKNLNVSFVARCTGKNINLISISAYNRFSSGYPGNYEADFTNLDILSGNNTYPHGQHNFSEEVRLSSSASKRIQWLGGLFAFSQKYSLEQTFNYGADAVIIDPNAPYSTITHGKVNNRGISFFGQVSFDLAKGTKLSVGGRIDNEKRALSRYTDSVKGTSITTVVPEAAYTNSFSKFTPKLTLSYDLSSTQLLYVSYAKGYRVGGFNAGASADKLVYNPENSDNAEIGYKSTFLNNKIRFNAALYYLYLKGHQVSTTDDGINYYYLNLGNYRNAGVETELAAIVAKGLQAEWNFSYTDGRFTKLNLFDGATGTTKNYDGNRIIFAPPITSMLALQYNCAFGKSKSNTSAFIRGEWRQIGDYYFDYYNAEKQDGYGLLNARAGVNVNKYEIAFWMRNLTDKRYITYGSQSPAFPLYMVSNPRMWGVTLTGKF